jgi:hypothetical protein
MWAMKTSDRDLLEEYKALGTPEEIRAKLYGPLPDDEDRAPLPLSDHTVIVGANSPAEAAVMAYEDQWSDGLYSGLIEEDA